MSKGNTEANRHGIPRRGSEPQQCIWPSCPKTVPRGYEVTRLCLAHGLIVATEHERQRRLLQNPLSAVVEPPKPEPGPSVIYYLRVGSYIKIGSTRRLEQRMRSYPPDTTLLAVHPGEKADEQALHRRFAIHRSHGREWYPLVPVILEHIDSVVSRHGAPEQITFGARPARTLQPRTKEYIGGPALAHKGFNSRPLRG